MKRRHFGHVGGQDLDVVSKYDKTVLAFTRKNKERRVKLSKESSQTHRVLITDGRLELEALSLLKKPEFLFRYSIDEDVEVMLDDSYKWLRQLGERRFFISDMKRMFSFVGCLKVTKRQANKSRVSS